MPPVSQPEFLAQLGLELPAEYLAYLFQAASPAERGAAYLVKADQLVQLNLDYEAAEFYPGYLLMGSDGGGEAIALEKATGYFVLIPFIGHDEETPIIIGRTWDEFFRRFQAGNLVGD